MISISGVFAVTFSVVFAYVADVTPGKPLTCLITVTLPEMTYYPIIFETNVHFFSSGEQERSAAYGLVSATFAASLVTSPALGSYVESAYGKETLVALATAIAALDVLFVIVAVPESLPQKQKVSAWAPLAWEQADPFQALRKVGQDKTILLLCVTVFLSYLPEVRSMLHFIFYNAGLVSY